MRLKPLIAAALMTASATAPASAEPPAPARPAERPPQSACAAVRDIDLRALARRPSDSADAARAAREQTDFLGREGPSDDAPYRPGEDAVIVIRAGQPAGFGSANVWALVWRDADGGWWAWRRIINPYAPPPLPPPPPTDPGSPPPPELTHDQRYPAETGRVAPDGAARLEAAYRDRCRAWDPDAWPAVVPLNRRIDGQRRRICAPDGGVQFADVIEAGRPPRRVTIGCRNDSPTFVLVNDSLAAQIAP